METDDNTRMPRRNRAFWQAHTDQWKQSGLSKIAYSKQHDLKPVSFYNWSKKLENLDTEHPGSAIAPATFLPVTIEQRAEKIHNIARCVLVQRAATDITLPVDLDADQIQHWLHAIHTLHA